MSILRRVDLTLDVACLVALSSPADAHHAWGAISPINLTSASVRVNDTYFNTTRYNTSAWRNL